jgi:hypothetical protein
MSRFVVATNYPAGRFYFCGAFEADPQQRFLPIVNPTPFKAFAVPERAAADAMAAGLTDLSRILPPFDTRTWFVVELPKAVL